MEVYLDNSATTKPCEAAAAALREAVESCWHNPSALYRPALTVEKKVREAREACLRAAGAEGQRLIFTASGTEADNLAILGHMRTVRQPGRVLIFDSEHPAVRNCGEPLERMGHRVEEIPAAGDGTADLAALERMLGEDVRLICLMQVNNESGAIQPIAEAVRLRDRLAPAAAIHVDGVQGFLRVPVAFNRSGIQSYTFSGHKIHALKGIGGLIARKDHRLSPIVYGGGQEENYRSGTENTPGILSLGAAVRAWPEDSVSRMMERKRQLWEGLRRAVPGAVLNGPDLDTAACSPHILNVSLPPVRSQTMLFALEGDGVYVSAGSACSSHRQKVSAVLTHMGVSQQNADCALRFSLCPAVTGEEIDYVIACVAKQYALLSKFTRR